MGRRRFLIPEVVQTSGMDCGPAALASLAAGFGVPAGYARLREVCQTDVDGTSIDALEDIARLLGLDATQVLMPADHVACDELPAIALVLTPQKTLHFVVAWRRVGRWVQLMDPAVGRRWTTVRRFRDSLAIHEMDLAADAVAGLAAAPSFGLLLVERLSALGMRTTVASSHVATAVERGPGSVYALDAATRAAARAGADHTVVAELASRAEDEPTALPPGCWFAKPAADSPDGAEVHLRGAVLVTVSGPLRADEHAPRRDVPEALREATNEPAPKPIRELARLAGGWRSRLVGLVLAAVLGFGGALLGTLGLEALEGDGAAALAGLAGALLLVELGAAAVALRAGRCLESGLRRGLYHRIPRLPDQYFRSRPTSDTAERAHRIHTVHDLPPLALAATRAGVELTAVGAALVIVLPRIAPLAIAAAAAAIGIPLLAAPFQQERDLRVRTHGGALARSWLDAVAGWVPLRAHRAEWVLEQDNESLLHEWSAASGAARRLAVGVEGLQAFAGVAFAVALVGRADAVGADGAQILLVAYWALRVVGLGQTLAAAVRMWPLQRAVAMRFLEPLSTPVDGPEPLGFLARPASPDGVAIDLRDLTVESGGHTILAGVDMSIPGGQHVAVVGSSGAGKSTLVGVLLGWVLPVQGDVLVDGSPLDHEQRVHLRRSTAWIAPEVSLWRGSVSENVAYGTSGVQGASSSAAADDAELTPVLAGLDSGWSTPLGDAGRRLSGGEGQRVRVARALARDGVRLAVLDEAFRGMPRDQCTRLLARCRRRWDQATLVYVTHDVSDALDFDRVLVVEDGRIVEDGAPRTLAADSGSRLRALLDAERELTEMLHGRDWRRFELNAGRLTVGDRDHTLKPAPAAGLGHCPPPHAAATSEQLDAVRRAAPRWWPTTGTVPEGAGIARAAEALGLRAERMISTRALLADTLREAGRAVVCHADGGATAVVGGRVDAAVLADLAAGVAQELPGTTTLGPRATEALRQAEAAEQDVPGVWRLRPDPAVGLRAAARWAGIPWRLAAFAVANAVGVAASLLGFRILGGAALDETVGSGTIITFGLVLSVLVPARAASVSLGQRVAVDSGRILKRRLLRGALSLPSDAARQEGVGRVMGRIVEAEAVEDQAVSGALGAAVAVVELFAAALVLANGVDGPVLLAGLGVLSAAALVAIATLVRRRRAWATARLDVSLDLVEKLLGQRTRVVQQPPEQWASGESERVDVAAEASRRVDRTTTALLAGLAPAWLAFGAVTLAFAGAADRTGFAIALGGVLLATSGLERLGRGSADLAGAVAAFDACRPLTKAAASLPGVPPTHSDVSGALQADGLVVRHPSRPDAILDTVSLSIAHGDRVVLRGPSGAGKSTLAAVLAGIHEPDGGNVRRSGEVVLAAQFHENHVLLGPIAFNLLLGRGWPHSEADLAEAERVCVALGLDRVLGRMPNGFGQIIGETGWQLSHGETHLLNVARALLQGGSTVILDESLGALDPVTTRVVLDVLSAAAPAVVVIAQD